MFTHFVLLVQSLGELLGAKGGFKNGIKKVVALVFLLAESEAELDTPMWPSNKAVYPRALTDHRYGVPIPSVSWGTIFGVITGAN